jgi:hypothetical protein
MRWETFMKLSASLLALSFLFVTIFVASNAFAHGDKVHVSGTVEKISPESVLVRTRDGKSVEVKLVASTVYISHVIGKAAKPGDLSEDKPAKLSDIAVGNLVVIHATPKKNALEADEIKFSAPAAPKSAVTAPAKPKP